MTDRIPRDLGRPALTANDALEWVDRRYFAERETIREQGAIALHHGLGQHMRNMLGMWETDSPLAQHFKTIQGLHHPDDMSNAVLERYVAWLNEGKKPEPHQRGYLPPKMLERATAYDMIEDDDGQIG